MPNKTAERLVLRDGDRARLEWMVRTDSGAAAMARRARIVLLAADGVGNQVIAERVGVSRPTVNLWRSRYAEAGMAGLVEQQRPGRPRRVDRAAVLTATLTPPPKALGVTHWSSRLLAPRLGVDHATVAAVGKEYGVKPVTVTNRIPADGGVGTNESKIALADFSQIAVARDLAPTVKVLDQTFGDYDQMALRVVARYDAKPLNAGAVVTLEGITGWP